MKVYLFALLATGATLVGVGSVWEAYPQNAEIGTYMLIFLLLASYGWFSVDLNRWRLMGGLIGFVPVWSSLIAVHVMASQGRVATLVPAQNLLLWGWASAVMGFLLGLGVRSAWKRIRPTPSQGGRWSDRPSPRRSSL